MRNPYLALIAAIRRREHPEKPLSIPPTPIRVMAPETSQALDTLEAAREFYQVEFRHYGERRLLPAACGGA